MKIRHMDSMPAPPDGLYAGDMDVCHVCGKELKGQRLFFEVVDGGYVHDPAAGPADTSDPGYMGFYPVGRDCARKFDPGIVRAL